MSPWPGRIVVVTGGSAGIGKEIARACVARGAQVVLAARNEGRLGDAARELSRSGGKVATHATDVRDSAAVAHLIRSVHQEWGRLDMLFHVAGQSTRGRLCETSADKHRELWELNFLSAVHCLQEALPLLRESGGSLVLMGSLASLVAGPYLGAYPCSKFPLAALAQQLRLEEGSRVHVLLVCPGPIARGEVEPRYGHESQSIPRAAHLPAGGARLKQLDPGDLAQRILRACDRRQAELIVPTKVRWLLAIRAFSPALADWLLRRSMRSG